MEYEIVATLGPASNNESIWRAMITAGVTTFRLNTSHISPARLPWWLNQLSPMLRSVHPSLSLVLDLQGSKWRLGHFPSFKITAGQEVELVFAKKAVSERAIPVPHADFFEAAAVSGSEIVLDDARVRLGVLAASSHSIRAVVRLGGIIRERKGITYTTSNYRKESLTQNDRFIIEKTRHLPSVRYALSYVKDGKEMARYREVAGDSTYLIAKLERKTAVDEAGDIEAFAHELWLCRGDLGAEVGFKTMAETVHRFSKSLDSFSRPVLMAGQVLEHMSANGVPTRSEICHLYDILKAGYAGIILSDETAIGCYPVESCHQAAQFR